eukprot:TRINITY_DN7105_c0_g1_i1.p1 TRINITY_DN7105_c0_g1~~TRINITY_DN7105_c0_g1_i1.p1  ORF type:complete len:429 (+),score=-70.98 TRINITY_DN7105_c0_g1_i1:326-1612(+)
MSSPSLPPTRAPRFHNLANSPDDERHTPRSACLHPLPHGGNGHMAKGWLRASPSKTASGSFHPPSVPTSCMASAQQRCPKPHPGLPLPAREFVCRSFDDFDFGSRVDPPSPDTRNQMPTRAAKQKENPPTERFRGPLWMPELPWLPRQSTGRRHIQRRLFRNEKKERTKAMNRTNICHSPPSPPHARGHPHPLTPPCCDRRKSRQRKRRLRKAATPSPDSPNPLTYIFLMRDGPSRGVSALRTPRPTQRKRHHHHDKPKRVNLVSSVVCPAPRTPSPRGRRVQASRAGCEARPTDITPSVRRFSLDTVHASDAAPLAHNTYSQSPRGVGGAGAPFTPSPLAPPALYIEALEARFLHTHLDAAWSHPARQGRTTTARDGWGQGHGLSLPRLVTGRDGERTRHPAPPPARRTPARTGRAGRPSATFASIF